MVKDIFQVKKTPMMRQYDSIKSEHQDYILFFRMGDFYEMFFEDARLSAQELDLTLTSRDKGVPMAGVPHHSADNYILRLVKKGHKVAVCEQIEDPREAKGVVKRKVVRYHTPATLLDDGMLQSHQNSYFVSLSYLKKKWGISFLDISTGESFCYSLLKWDEVLLLFDVYRPKEMVVGHKFSHNEDFLLFLKERGILISYCEDMYFKESYAVDYLCRHFKVTHLDGFGLKNYSELISSVGALFSFLSVDQKFSLTHVRHIYHRLFQEEMLLDFQTIRNLELMENYAKDNPKASLLYWLDLTQTGAGGRLLRKWMNRPLCDRDSIEARLRSVQQVNQDMSRCDRVRELLKKTQDILRIVGRVHSGIATPQDCVALSQTLLVLPQIQEEMSYFNEGILVDLCKNWDSVQKLREMISYTLKDEVHGKVNDGGYIREGVDSELDECRFVQTHAKEWLQSYVQQEIKRYQIKTLKVGYNKVIGYFLEVSKGVSSKVPSSYIRRQTLTNSERFITEELKEKEEKILQAQSTSLDIEKRLFVDLCDHIQLYVVSLQAIADNLALIDVIFSFSKRAQLSSLFCPCIDETDNLKIEGGWHPVVQSLTENRFVTNDTSMDCQSNRIMLITGPNMAGKSTYIRQVALIVYLAQIGSFVPARSARIGVVDRIFTRLGASDELTRGQSTFMLEMTETAHILNNATSKSLVILDEVGRGTSTGDGVSLAWAITEYLHDRLMAKTLFATHYHELCALPQVCSGVRNFHVECREVKGEISFLHRLVEGGTDQSYGIHVAELAGVPSSVIQKSKELLLRLEKKMNISDIQETLLEDLPLFSVSSSQVREDKLLQYDLLCERLNSVDLDTLSPIEAWKVLSDLKTVLKQ